MKFFLFLALLASAAAFFTGGRVSKSSVTMKLGDSAPQDPDFCYGLVGSDIEAGQFDPFDLAAGRSEETINWYRAAELKVQYTCFCQMSTTLHPLSALCY
jgi:hypothetical protein